MTHTDLPWKVGTSEDGGCVIQSALKRDTHGKGATGWNIRWNIAHVYGSPGVEQEEYANRIVTAVNSHDALLEALEQAAMELEEASKILQPLRPGCADIFKTAAEQKLAIIKAARP